MTIGAPDHRLVMARQLSAQTTINFETLSDEKDRIAQVYELTDGRGADVVVEETDVYSAFTERGGGGTRRPKRTLCDCRPLIRTWRDSHRTAIYQ